MALYFHHDCRITIAGWNNPPRQSCAYICISAREIDSSKCGIEHFFDKMAYLRELVDGNILRINIIPSLSMMKNLELFQREV